MALTYELRFEKLWEDPNRLFLKVPVTPISPKGFLVIPCYRLSFEKIGGYPEFHNRTELALEHNRTAYYKSNDNEFPNKLYHFGIIDHNEDDKWWSSRPAVMRQLFNIEFVEIVVANCVNYMTKEEVLHHIPEGYCLIEENDNNSNYAFGEPNWKIVRKADIKGLESFLKPLTK